MPLPPSSPPLIALLGAPHTGTQALALALRQHIAAGAAQITDASSWLDASPTEPLANHSTARPSLDPALGPRFPPAALTLLMGLDQPCPADARAAQETIDTQLRAALAEAGVAYQVVYGQGERRIANALNAIHNIAPQAVRSSTGAAFDRECAPRAQRLRAWDCEKCSDPECEHRLFTTLLDSRQARPG